MLRFIQYLSLFPLLISFAHGQVVKTESCRKIIFGGVEVICLNKGIGAFSVEERAKAIEFKLKRLSGENTFDADRISVSPQELSSEITAGEVVLASISSHEVDNTLALDHTQMAQLVSKKMSDAIKADRALNSPTTLLWAAAYTAIATLGLILILIFLSWLFPKAYHWVRSNEGRFFRSISLKDYELLNSQRIVSFLLWLAKAVRIGLTLFTLYVYVPLVLSFFPLTANLSPKLYGYIITPLMTIFQVFIAYIPNLFFVIIIAIVARYFLKLLKFFFSEIENGSLHLEGFYKDWAAPTYKLVRILVIAFAFIMAFPYLPGSNSPAFKGVSVFLGILLSIGSSSAVANIVAGVVITYMRPFKVGDRVRIADTTGDVVEKTLLVTRVRSIKNVDVSIPNSMVLGSHIINYSTMANQEGLVLNTTITIGYDAPWRKVHELLKESARRTELIIKDPGPFVLQTALNDFYVSYELNAYTNSPNKMASIYSCLHQNIQDCFNEAGVEIMSPHYSTLRDGNETTIPSENRAKDYKVSGFKVSKET